MENPKILSFILSYLTLTYSVYRLFEKAGDTVRQEVKESLSSWLSNIKIKKYDNEIWITSFTEMFDATFTKKHISFQCFLRSIIASIISGTVLFLIICSTTSQDFSYSEIGMFLFGVIAFNGIADYISLLETRYLLKIMNHFKVGFIILIILVDIIITSTIFVCTFFLWSLAGFKFYDWNEWYDIISFSNSLVKEEETLGILFYTSFFTSAWLWLFLIISISIRLLNLIDIGVNISKRTFDIQNKPFRSIGFLFTDLSQRSKTGISPKK